MLKIEVLIGHSVFDMHTRQEFIEFCESLKVHLLQEISDLNHVIEWLKLEADKCENEQLEKELHLLEKLNLPTLGSALATLL
jgi:hypothetical protein